ncbi:TPA: hypothetical protein ACOFZX_003000, partial [Staphylococcus aureus]
HSKMIDLARPDIPRVLSYFKVISYKAVVSQKCDTTYSICHKNKTALFYRKTIKKDISYH